ncbi:MAG: hypothetical protein GY697_19230 [Desulfobacterales bacterium]|nr:hypothetical protein [Desulfobacterales bacterium]
MTLNGNIQTISLYGIIDAKTLETCLGLARERRQAIGRILIDEGYLTLKDLKKYMYKQVEEIIYNLFL